MKDKKGITITNAFQKIWDESDKGSEFYNRSMELWLEKDAIEMKEGRSADAERLIRILKNKICKYMTSISKNVYIDKLDDIGNRYNNTHHRTIKMKAVNVKSSTYNDFNKENDNEDPKFKVGDHVSVLKYKNVLAKGYVLGYVFVIKKVKNTVPWTVSDLKGEEIVWTFYEKELQKTSLELKK